MKSIAEAEDLARTMVDIGNNVGRNTMAVISDMSQPLGVAIGNALEVKEAIDTLRGEGPEDLTELSLVLGSQMAYLGGVGESLEDARKMLEENIKNGKALEKFKVFIEAQGGNPAVVDNPDMLPQAKYQIEVKADQDGYIAEIDAEELGIAGMLLGAGRATKDSVLDLAAGLMLHKKIGDKVSVGDTIVTIHSNSEDVESSVKLIKENIKIADHAEPVTLIHEVIR